MTWNATATVVHALQFAKAYASFASSTGSPCVRTSSDVAMSQTVELSRVLTASAWLSSGPGGSGGSNGNGQADSVSVFGTPAPDAGCAGGVAARRCGSEDWG